MFRLLAALTLASVLLSDEKMDVKIQLTPFVMLDAMMLVDKAGFRGIDLILEMTYLSYHLKKGHGSPGIFPNVPGVTSARV